MSSTISSSLKITPTSEIITLAGGCFWGVERLITKQFQGQGLVDIKCGYANGKLDVGEVTYQKVCSGSINFVEVVQVSYEPSEIQVEEILDIFFRIHDPTTVDSQGKDVGIQYRSAIFTHSNDQLKAALVAKEKAQNKWYPNHKIVTIIEPIKVYYDAEEYHQRYFAVHPEKKGCPNHYLRQTVKA
ncbi:peptide methionine sulfoxide reductase [[Candida] anglica]|uniref:peptide-methionine (S)-S-oxide reductase n=1 Tax=[Candida] anglica TaxID=148631 RepID=A0ABP0EH58_9ASCO